MRLLRTGALRVCRAHPDRDPGCETRLAQGGMTRSGSSPAAEECGRQRRIAPRATRSGRRGGLAAAAGIAIAVSVGACAGGGAPPTSQSSLIDQYIRGLGYLPTNPAQVVEGATSNAVPSGDYVCRTEHVKETRDYDKLVAYGTNSEALWPGAIIRGDAVYSGLLSQIVLPRKPLRFSVSLENLGGGKAATMDDPSLSSFRDDVSQILSQAVTGATPADIYSDIEQVDSKDQLSLALGTSVSGIGLPGDIAANFDFKSQNIHSRYVVKYVQAYYTVDADEPSAPSDLFADSVTLDQVKSEIPSGKSPVYVSSITYGRVILFTFESQYSQSELGAALNFAYHGGVDVSGNTSVTYKEMLSSSKMTAYILGGSGSAAAQSIDSYQDLINLIKSGGDYSSDSPGAPIAYKLAYVKDNTPVRLSLTQDYNIPECERVSQDIQVTLENIKVVDSGNDPGGNLEIYGTVDASADSSATLFDRDRGHYVQISSGKKWPTSGSVTSAIIKVKPQAGNSISLHAKLTDYDTLFGDDLIGDQTVTVPFETGWRKEVPVYLTGGGAGQVVVTFGLQPI